MGSRGLKSPTLYGQQPCTQPICTECPLTSGCGNVYADTVIKDWIDCQVYPPCTLATLKASGFAQWDCQVSKKKEQEEKECAMRACIDTQETRDSSLEYINRRLREIQFEKSQHIGDQFQEVQPKTCKQAKEWLKEGNYHISLPAWYAEDMASGYMALEYFAWGKEAPDTKKRDALMEGLNKAYQEAKDTVAVLTDEQARLKALKDFESYSVQ